MEQETLNTPQQEVKPKGFEAELAKLISLLLHPLIMPTLAIFLLFQLNTYLAVMYSGEQQRLIYSILIICTFAMPGLSALFMLSRGMVTSFDINNQRERWIPYFTTFLFYAFTYAFFLYLDQYGGIHQTIRSIILACAIAVGAGMLINRWFKISVHMTAIGGVVGILASLNLVLQESTIHFLFPTILAAGLLGYARLKLKAHQPAEVYAGFAMGFTIEYLIVVMGLG